MTQQEAPILVHVQTNVVFKEHLYQLLSRKGEQAVEKRMVMEDVME